MNMVDFRLTYQGITRTVDTQSNFYNYLAEDIIDNTYDRCMIWRAKGGRKTIVDSDEETVDDNNPLFGRIN